MKAKRAAPPAAESERVLWGFGMAPGKRPGKWIVYRLSNRGQLEILSPSAPAESRGERKDFAASRLIDEMARAYGSSR